MRIGINAAQNGRLADPAAIAATARAAEQVGYSSLWVFDRLERHALDPLLVLATVAAVTTRIRVGTSVLAAPRYGVSELVRSLDSLDVLSEGRLTIGLGLGGADAGTPTIGRGADDGARHLERVLDALDVRWPTDPVETTAVIAATRAPVPTGATVATSSTGAPVELVPTRQSRPPVLLSASTPTGLARVAGRADGWNPTAIEPDTMRAMWDHVRALAADNGRDPPLLQLVVRADVVLTEHPRARGRRRFCGTIEQVAADLAAFGAIGADEVILRAGGDVGLDESLDLYARVAEAAGAP